MNAAQQTATSVAPDGSTHLPSPTIDLTEFKLGWKILIVALVGNGTGVAAMLLYGFGAMVVPLQQTFGWERSMLQVAMSFMFGGTVISAQLAGWFISRHGARPVAILSAIALAAGFVGMTQLHGSIWGLYVGFSCLGVLGLGTLHLTWTQLVNTWFDRNRALALAITLCGSGVAAGVLPLLVTWGMSRWDWRAGFLVMALILLLVTLPLILLWMRHPGLLNSKGRGAVDRSGEPGMSLREGLRSPRFWRCNIALVLAVSGVVALVTNTIPVMRDKGLSATEASQIFGAFGVSLIIGRIVVGYLADRVWAPGIAALALSLPGAGCLILAFGGNDHLLLVLAMALIGAGAGAEYDVAAFLVAKYFGMREYSRLFAVHTGMITVGASLTPLLVGALYRFSGSYNGLLSYAVICFSVGPLLLLTLGRYPQFKQS